MSEPQIPEPDRVTGAPHPRETVELFGHARAEADFVEALRTGRLHHAWLLAGPRGIGKATLAWRIARRLLASGADGDAQTLDLPRDHPVFRSTAALSEPRLFLLRRVWDADAKRLKTVITVDEVRRMKSFFGLSAADGARRVVIVDAADEMNVNAANALLKILEEPPSDAIILLVSHSPARLLPTIRSRCRVLACTPLAPDDLARALSAAGVHPGPDAAALAELSGGSAGEALRLAHDDGLTIYRQIVDLLRSLPSIDRDAALRLTDAAAGRTNESRYDATLRLLDLAMVRLARSGAGAVPQVEAAPGEAELASALAPTRQAAQRWADLQQRLAARARHGRAVNLDPPTLLLDMVLKMNQTAAELTRRRGFK